MSDEREHACRCAHPVVLDQAALYRWPPGTEVTWCLDGSSVPATLPANDGLIAVAGGIAPWPRACGVTTRQVLDPTQARVLIGFAPIDGPWNVLGQTELPADGNALATHRMTLDSSEAWTIDWLRKVVMHEIGHALGVGHAPAPIRAVMSPIYDPGLDDLQPWDKAEAQERYGLPSSLAPDGPPRPPLTFEGVLTVEADGPRSLEFPAITVDFPEPGNYQVTITVTRSE